jgi:hypothetical protein
LLFLDKKQPKIKSAEMFLCRTWPLQNKTDRTTGCNYFARSPYHRFCKNLLCPIPTHKATIVLPAFARNLSADEGGGD